MEAVEEVSLLKRPERPHVMLPQPLVDRREEILAGRLPPETLTQDTPLPDKALQTLLAVIS